MIGGFFAGIPSWRYAFVTLAASSARDTAKRALIRSGMAAVAVGSAGFALAVPTGSLSGMVVCGLLQGAGFGLCWPAIVTRIVRGASRAEPSLASASVSTTQRIGYAVGSAAVGIAANLSGLAEGVSVAVAKTAGFWVFAAFVPVLVLGLWCAWLFTSRASDSRAEDAEAMRQPLSSRSTSRSVGNSFIQSSATTTVPMPPTNTLRDQK